MINDVSISLSPCSPLVATIHDVLSERRIEEILSAAAGRLEEPKTISSANARVKTNPASRTGKVSLINESRNEK